VSVPKKRAARSRKRAKAPRTKPAPLPLPTVEEARKVVDDFMREAVGKIGIAVKDRLQVLMDMHEELADVVEALHERIEIFETMQGIFRPQPQQPVFCDCENCRLRWN
jgi:hypothetical protein